MERVSIIKQRMTQSLKGNAVRGPIFRKADEPTGGRDFHSQVMPYGPLTLHRPVFLDMLRAKLHPERCRIQISKRLIRYCGSMDGAPVTLHFEDGTTATADVLIGSDGVHSMVRATMFAGNPKYAEPKWSGEISYRAQCLQEEVRQKYPSHPALGAPKLVSAAHCFSLSSF
jgi:salicylate hydroxylase